MSDCGLCLTPRNDAGDKSAYTRVLESLATFRGHLGSEPVWNREMIPGQLVVLEYWGEQGDDLVLVDGELALAEYGEMEINGETVSVPVIPEGNPPGHELFDRLLELDRDRLDAALRAAGLDQDWTAEVVSW